MGKKIDVSQKLGLTHYTCYTVSQLCVHTIRELVTYIHIATIYMQVRAYLLLRLVVLVIRTVQNQMPLLHNQ